MALGLVGAAAATIALVSRDEDSRFAAGHGRATASPALPPALPPRTGGDISPFQGMGTWIDLYDTSWSSPRSAVAGMAARGVRTLYVETSNFNRPTAVVYPAKTERFVDAAHDAGMDVVAWYLPGFTDPELDLRMAIAAIRFRTARGDGFDAFGLDIESPEVRDPALRSARLVALSERLREAAGEYPLGAIIASPRGMERNRDYWPDFPYANIAGLYDVVLPMTYYSWRVSDLEGARSYTSKNIAIIRREVGTDQIPIHVIGGIADGSDDDETRGFVQAVREFGIIGASFYTYPLTAESEWPLLQQITANPVQTPALPAPFSATEMGNIPGGDTTHPHEVSYRTRGKTGLWDLRFDAFDVQAGEVQITVNWEPIATVAPGAAGAWTDAQSIPVPAFALVTDGPNVISFVAVGEAPTWGVRAVSLVKQETASATPSPS
ncbi:MAG: hypothetical protein H0W82_09155 [Actinobacteria bacterium]|nr:hypothetical protein [Actinomycetota bacterium]